MFQIGNTLRKHAQEITRALRNHKHETDPVTGLIHLTRSKLALKGTYRGYCNGEQILESPNLITTEGLNYLLDAGVANGTKIATWYLALYSGAVSPAAAWNASNFTSNSTEITSNTEGFSETTRRTFTPATPAAGVATNTASKASFTMATATSVTVNGAGLLSVSTKGGTTGKLLSASRFSAAKTFNNADVFQLEYELDGTST